MMYILSQVFGVLAFVFVFASMQFKDIKHVLLCLVGCNGFQALSYILIGGFTACGLSLIATIQSLIFYFIRRSGKDEPRWLQTIVLVSYIICCALTFRSWVDLLPTFAAALFAIGSMQKNSRNYRILMLFNGALWVAYDVVILAYTMLGSHIFTVVSALLGIVRLDILKKTNGNSNNDTATE